MLKAARKIRRGKTVRAVAALILREMETTFGRSPGGYLWAVAEPVAAIALLSIGFGLALQAPALGASFALFYASGYLPFTMTLDTANKVANAIRFSRPLLTYPAVTFLDALLARFALNLLTHALIFCVVIAGIAGFLGAHIMLDLPRVLSAMAMASVLGLGIGTVNCLLFNIWPLWERIWQIVTRPLFIVSGVFFLPEAIPLPYSAWLMLNPVVHVVGEMRRGLYAGYEAPGVSHVYVYALGLGCLALGLVLLGRHHRAILGEG